MLGFVYGTLTDPARAAAVLDDWAFEGDAVLSGLHRVDGEHPTLAPGGLVEGRLLRTGEVDRLDAYEGVGAGLYVRVAVPLEGAPDGWDEGAAEVYVGDPDRLGAPVAWPGEGEFGGRVAAYVAGNDVVVRRVEPAGGSTDAGSGDRQD